MAIRSLLQHQLTRAFACVVGLLAAQGAMAMPALDRREVMPVGEIRQGMKGYGLTVFRGTRIERFNFEVLSVMPKQNMGKPLILVRLSGGPITSRGAFGIQGMSGSPCYLNGRLVGAYAYLPSGFPKEPIGMVTPIEDMAEALDPALSTQPAGMSAPPIDLNAAFSGDLSTLLNLTPPMPSSVRPLGLPVMVSGLSPHLLNRVSQFLAPFNLAAVSGPGRMPMERPISMVPGSAIAVSLLTGDVEMTGVGTVTYRRGKELLAFGHPMFQLGATNFPITTAYVHDVFPGMQISFKMASPVSAVGTLTQDRPWSVAARLGALPQMVPLTCSVVDKGTGRSRTYRCRAANHPLLVSRLLPIAADQAIFEVHSVPGDATATVDLSVDTAEFGTLRRRNVFFDARAVDVAAVNDLLGLMSILNDNSFRRINVKGVSMKVTIEPKRDTAVVERIFVPQDRYEPGDTVDVGVVLRPYRGEPYVTRTSIRIPENAASGRASLVVSGGPAPPPGQVVVSGGGATVQTGSGSAAPVATNVQQLLRRFLERERNDQIVTRVQFASNAVNVGGEALPMLPAHLADLMRSGRTSGVRMEREEVKIARDMPCVVSGAQTLSIQIERNDRSEKRSAGSSSGTSVTTTDPTPTTTTSPGSLSLSDDDEAASVTGPSRLLPEAGSGDASRIGLDSKKDTASATRRRGKRGEKETKSSESGSESAGGSTPASTTATPPAEDASVLGRKALTWRQTTQSDFERGTFTGLAVTATGEIRPAATLSLLSETPEQYVWSVAAVGSEVYAGTGNGGLVYRIGPSGHPDIFYRTGELEVHALAKDGTGNLYAGTSPGGKVFRIRPNGQAEEILSINPTARDRLSETPRPAAAFVLALAVAPDGTVYAGTGPEGKVYRIPTSGEPKVLFKTRDRFIQSLLAAPDGTVYAGTAESGLVYAIRPDGIGRVVLDSDQSAITALARDGGGDLYAATASTGATKGSVLRIALDGGVKTLWEKSKQAITALVRDGAGTLYAAAGSTIYRISGDESVTILSEPRRAQLTSLDLGSGGELVAGSVNVGSVFRLVPAREGTYESVVHDAKVSARWGEIRWLARGDADAVPRIETRTGDSPEPDATWSAWTAPQSGVTGRQIASPSARFIQYRVTLSGSGEENPALREVSLTYLPVNRPPTVGFAAPAGGEFWKGTATVRWTGSDPDRDTIAYDVFYSTDERTWIPLGRPPVEITKGGAAAEPASKGTEAEAAYQRRVEEQLASNPALARFRDELAQDAEVSAEMRTAALQRADQLIARYDAGKATASTGTAGASAAPPPKATGVRESTFAWDTTGLPDGLYRLRVVASDRPSNAAGALTAEAISEPIQLVNRKPSCFIFRKSARRDEGGMVRVDGLADGRAPLAGAQFRLDGGEWSACEAADGIWDSRFEAFTCTAANMARGEHTLEVKLVDAAGNIVTKTATIRVNS